MACDEGVITHRLNPPVLLIRGSLEETATPQATGAILTHRKAGVHFPLHIGLRELPVAV